MYFLALPFLLHSTICLIEFLYLCHERPESWCKWQVAKTLGKEYHTKIQFPKPSNSLWTIMGNCGSQLQDFPVPTPPENWNRWGQGRCTVRAPHHLEYRCTPGECTLCKVAFNRVQKTKYFCSLCGFYYCFNKEQGHFVRWHSKECDHFRYYI